MKNVKILFINVILLTATSLLIRTIGLTFQVYLSNTIGAAGMGIFQLIMSIYFLAITCSASGIRLATTRLVAEELGVGQNSGAKKAIRICMIYAVLLSITIATILYLSSGYIGTHWLCEPRTILSLRCLAFTLPFVAMSSVLGGYFTAVRRAIKVASVQIAEQVIKISITVVFLTVSLSKGLEYICLSIVIGSCIGEFFSFLLLYFLYIFDIRRYKSKGNISHDLISRMFYIVLPISLSAYVTSGMRTVQQLLIPSGLKKSGASSEVALAAFGTIQGMVMPVLMFPSVLLGAVTELIVPELAECLACGSQKRLNYIINRVLKLNMFFSIYVMSVFLFFSNELCIAIYHNSNAALSIRILAPIIPIIYLDALVDAILKGVGEQASVMRYNIVESFLSVSLIYILLPRFAISGYFFTMMISRLLNFSLSVNRLVKVSDLNISTSSIIKAIICAVGSLNLSNLFYYMMKYGIKLFAVSLPVRISMAIIVYFILLRLFSCITHDDILWFKSIFSSKER